MKRCATVVLMAFVLTIVRAAAQEPAVLRGSWAATVGAQTLQGTWTAQSVRGEPNTAQGSWSLVNRTNQITATGTWAAAKAARGWTGSWQARIATRNRSPGRVLSGTWSADASTANVTSLVDLFEKTLQQQISGTWARGPLRGAWSLRGSKS